MSQKNDEFYLTAAIPYVNAKPHIGHALEFLQGDVLARYYRNNGRKVFYVTGADENSLKIVRAAEEAGKEVQVFADENAQSFQDFLALYHVSIDKFQRSSSEEHKKSAQALWEACDKSGDIYEKEYEGLYCVSCEAFYTEGDLVNGECPYHPGKPIETIKEKNYFFKLSKYQDRLIELIESDTYAITPLSAKNEALAFIKRGLEDFSISRSKERARGWGVEVPNNSEQFMYVWFDALNVYRSAAPHYWPADLHIIGKDILRFHAVYWPAMLLSAGEKLPKALFVHGFITSDGKKMSKSLGNVVDPVELVNTYGLDAVRYFLLAGIASDGDGDFSKERFEEKYTADLVNGLGNFAFRVLTLAQKYGSFELDFEKADTDIKKRIADTRNVSGQKIEKLAFHDALFDIFELVRFGDGYLNDTKPWDSSVSEEEAKNVILQCLFILEALASWLVVFLPETSAAIDAALNRDGSTVSPVKPDKPFFARLEK